jgi:hypothetical protein
MASIQIVDSPTDSRFYSVYSPIKYTARVSGSNANGQTGTVNDYVSLRVRFTPYNETTDQWMNGSSVSSAGNNPLPDETFAIRVQFTPFVYGFSIDSAPNDGTYRYFSIDVSSLLRNQLSYNLRPCSHDTLNNKIKRDITLNQIATNLHSRFEISFTPEYINSSGVLVQDLGLREFRYIRPINAALTYEEEINGYISSQILEEDDTYPQLVQHSVIDDIYTHKPNLNENYYAKKKYLSVKPRHRYIGVDECEYLTFAARRNSSDDGVYVIITFYDSNGNTIDNGQTSGYYGVNINATANGDGTSTSDNSLFTYGDGGNSDPLYAVMQVGVGTRNIKELAIQDGSKFRDSQPISDFSNVAYYTVSTHLDESPYNQIGETITYYIDHERTNYKDNVRFHWQSRLGGIDSYTFDGGMTRGIETSSSTYEQTIYPQFRGGLGASASTNNLFIGDHDWQTAASQNGGAFVARRSGLTDDQYPAIRKHHVDAFGNGTAVSRPLDMAEMGMIEDLMSSPNVWVERGWRAKEIFREDFSSYTSLSDVSNNWNFISGALDSTSDAFVTDEGHITGNKALKVGDNSGNDYTRIDSKATFNYNPNKLYEFEIRIKGVQYQNDNAPLYFGMNGLAANGTTYINTLGADSTSSQHYFGASNLQLQGNDEYVVLRGYISGFIRDGGSYGGYRPDPMNHARAYTGVKKFEPIILLNYGGGGFDGIGTTILDYIKVTEYTPAEETHAKVWSSLNKHYYVPALIKDGSKQLYNSEELTTISLDYVESRKKRGIRN